jgi:hypothetical protein
MSAPYNPHSDWDHDRPVVDEPTIGPLFVAALSGQGREAARMAAKVAAVFAASAYPEL